MKFWCHEWFHHGYFSGLTPYEYFNIALHLKGSLDPSMISGQTKSLQDTATDVQNTSGVFPEIHMNRDAGGTLQVLEVRIRYDNTLQQRMHRARNRQNNVLMPLFTGVRGLANDSQFLL